jgi:hypothetical protein
VQLTGHVQSQRCRWQSPVHEVPQVKSHDALSLHSKMQLDPQSTSHVALFSHVTLQLPVQASVQRLLLEHVIWQLPPEQRNLQTLSSLHSHEAPHSTSSPPESPPEELLLSLPASVWTCGCSLPIVQS